MFRSHIFNLLLLAFINISTSHGTLKNNTEVEGYYWRDYKGFIPHDAFPGGNEKGSITYIGQVLHDNALIPATIVQDEGKAYYEYGLKVNIATENVKILCTDNPTQLKWLSSSKTVFKNIKSKRFVNGGYDSYVKTYIGRMEKKGDTLIGKVIVNDSAILHTTRYGKTLEAEEFEVLYFDDPIDEAAISTKGYYWRDYIGIIPNDALLGGIEGKRTTYIALVPYNNLLVPGKIIDGEKIAHFEWGLDAHTATSDIKIFCTDKPEHFHWFRTSSGDFRKIKDKHFVLASHEGDAKLYIGRISADEDMIVGKLLVNENVVLHAARGDNAIQRRIFEVLYYDPPTDERR